MRNRMGLLIRWFSFAQIAAEAGPYKVDRKKHARQTARGQHIAHDLFIPLFHVHNPLSAVVRTCIEPLFHGIHTLIQLSAQIRAMPKLPLCGLVKWNILFIPQLVFKAGPRIHGNGAQLDLRPHDSLFMLKEDRHGDDQMKASLAVGLRMLDIILGLDQRDVVLLQKRLRQHVDVFNKGTYDPYSRDVVQVLLNAIH